MVAITKKERNHEHCAVSQPHSYTLDGGLAVCTLKPAGLYGALRHRACGIPAGLYGALGYPQWTILLLRQRYHKMLCSVNSPLPGR